MFNFLFNFLPFFEKKNEKGAKIKLNYKNNL